MNKSQENKPSMEKGTLKNLKPTPLIIVEDHNDVVPFIHRNIGSKHLPFDDIVFVHFDSHPDLLIPSELKADDVFKKDVLYDIENWIIPLVYAGHISHVIWFKPPWCEQIQDKEIQFYVGKCSSTGFIRTTCKESYFVSETLYSPVENLVNKKEVKLTVITIQPLDWKPDSNKIQEIKSERNLCNVGDSSNQPVESNSLKHSCDVDDLDQHSCKRHCAEKPTKAKNQKILSNNIVSHDEVSGNDCKISSHLTKVLQNLHKSLSDKKYILDIDLDFFSTQNPFKLLYSKEVYDMLKELYVFDKPEDLSDEAINRCNTKREEQLSHLRSIFYELHNDSRAQFEHLRKDLIVKIRDAVMKADSSPDFELLHEAGCTCDDTELPDHVSSEGEITQLISAVQETLSYFHKPVIITVARSSLTDEYCPPNQVDFIQEQTLEMLQDLYLEINVTKNYDDQTLL